MSVSRSLASGDSVRLAVPASSANLGPAFDAAGLCLDLHDDIEVAVQGAGCAVQVSGEGERTVPRDETHLVIRAVRAGLEHAGLTAPGLALRAHNRIPHGRGLGSSAAATVGGLLAARALASCVDAADRLPDEQILALATAFEGHADNVAATLHGGLTLVWSDGPGPVRAARLDVDPDVVPVVVVPHETLSTDLARDLLPTAVPHASAAHNAARAALLVVALTRDPSLLLDATSDRLHEPYRAAALPASVALRDELRARGHAATISGAGPSLLVLTTRDAVASVEADLAACAAGWRRLRLEVDRTGARVLA